MASIILRSTTGMTSINDSGFGFDIGSAADFYQWRTSNGAAFTITALSGSDNITVDGGGLPLTGTITGLVALNELGAIAYVVTDLAVPLIGLVDADPAVSAEKYWETILAGATSFTNEDNGAFNLTGDFVISDIVTGKANPAAPFTFQTTPLTGAGQVTFTQTANNTIISGSTDGDAAAEFTILVRGLLTFSADDFIL